MWQYLAIDQSPTSGLIMCGRFAQKFRVEIMGEMFAIDARNIPADLTWDSDIEFFNVSPSQQVLAVMTGDPMKAPPVHSLEPLQWGFVPAWTTNRHGTPKLTINARSETVDSKPTFKPSLQKRRCIIPALGFYEWRKTRTEKQAYFIRARNGGLLALAGLWEHGQASASSKGLQKRCAILTTSPNKLMQPIHDRMPVILSPDQFSTWLNPMADLAQVISFMTPCPSELLEAYPVSSYVNSPANQGPACIEPTKPAAPPEDKPNSDGQLDLFSH